MAKTMKICAIISAIATASAILLYLEVRSSVFFALSITFSTIAYHFIMRLCVGYGIHWRFHNHIDHTQRWFQPWKFEEKLYTFLNVKQWKKHLPTYDPSSFSTSEHSLSDIVGAMCQAEIVHEIIIPLSFIPVFFIPLFGEPWVFILTSILSAVFDLSFVIIQRFNRPRVIRLLSKKKL
jgi:hypothetical protein